MYEIKAQMAGTILKINKNVAGRIEIGEELVVIESMKMEIPIEAQITGLVEKLMVEVGDFVNEGDLLMTVNKEES
ncbi:acetyl-CoA carboxylase biotin carboxyl carrier protein subunit [Bacillus carboniphilus]|uniref:Acetyl-CoA carboxylase biotin carboxyl carrier protein subunit n=1 Tax=Bacillus carboniphilus TaxID=86663 RepID=A0ABY9JYL6_9BACI|nr:acetyl-CoA carboxylase biotin carboxyl carrier protein subunit [Bacillus carboniphilus]WLR43637.1 acetyl-CoA carboxylase biotin carboxyl carrier protein subunit [Bacillus carboniphilus]